MPLKKESGKELLPSQPNQSLINGFKCLEAVAASDSPVGIRELSRLLGMDKTLTNRQLMTLASIGILSRTDSGKYMPGPGIHVLSALSMHASGLLQAAMPLAGRWRDDGFSFTLGVLWRNHICHLIHARPEIPLELSTGGEGIKPFFSSSAGLILAASCKDADKIMHDDSFNPDLFSKALSLEDIFSKTKTQGYAELEYKDGTKSLGVSVGSSYFAGIAVSKRKIRNEDIPVILGKLREDAAILAEKL